MTRFIPGWLVLCSTLGFGGATDEVEHFETAAPGVSTPPPPVQIDMKAVVDRAMADANSYVGVSVIIIKDGKRYQYHYGEAVDGKGVRPNGNTYYAIGSVTKTFTGTLLALFDVRNYVDWNDLLSKHLGSGIHLSGGREKIRLRDIGLHRSGLPEFPPGGADGYETGGYDGDMAALRAEVGDCNRSPCRAPIEDNEEGMYSSWGFALLADVLADAKSMRVAGAFETYLLDPIGMNDTGFKYALRDPTCLAAGTTCNYDDYGVCSYVDACNDTFHRRAAVGYKFVGGAPTRDGSENGTGSNDYIKSGSGTLWSTPNDMSKWLAFHMDADGNQSAEMRTILAATHKARTDDQTAFFGKYQETTREDHGYIRKVGLIGNQFATFMGFTNDKKVGVIVMANAGSFDVTVLGETLIDSLK